MTERYLWKRSATRGFVLLLGIGAVSGAGYWSLHEITLAADQISSDWETFQHEFSLTDDDTIGVSSKVGTAATQCFAQAGGVGFSRILTVHGETGHEVVYRSKGNESIDPTSIEACIGEISGVHDVTVAPFIKEQRPDFNWEIAQKNVKDSFENLRSRILE